MPMKSHLVWTSDPEAAKRLRQEGAIDAQADQDPSQTDHPRLSAVVIDRKRSRGKECDHRQRIPAEGGIVVGTGGGVEEAMRCRRHGGRRRDRDSEAITSRA